MTPLRNPNWAKAVSEALGIKRAKEITIRLAAGELVTVEAVFYPTEEQLTSAVTEFLKQRFTLSSAENGIDS